MVRWMTAVLAAITMVMAVRPAHADHLGDPWVVSGEVVTSVTLDELVGILEPHGYVFSGDNYGGWHFVTPNGRDMYLNLEACRNGSCQMLRINGYWDLTGRIMAINVARAVESFLPSAYVALYLEDGLVALAVRRDLAIDLGVTTDNLVANFDLADANVGQMHAALVQADPELPAYWESLQ